MIKLTGVKKNYGAFELDCSMEVHPGMVTGLIGQNGAGKSTAFKAILNLISTDSGEISVFGKEHTKLTAKDKEKIGVVLAESGFSEYLTVKNIASIMGSMYSCFKKDTFLSDCGRFGLPTDKKIREFSTGMKAKLKLLTAISHGAELLILDEPTAGLDVVAREELLDMLGAYMEEDEKRSILISSHISGDLEKLCDDIYMIHDGNIILHEETDELLANYGVLKVEEAQYAKLDKSYLLKRRWESYGYSVLTNQRGFYLENYPGIAVEKGAIDEVILMMIKGEAV